ncbi:hypothetical protein OWT26_08260 [Burkholderia sp. 1A5]
MADKHMLDPADRTPPEVRAAIGEKRKAYPQDDCIPCGAVMHVGFSSTDSVVIGTTTIRKHLDTQISADFGRLIAITKIDVESWSLTIFGIDSTILDSERS